MAGTALINKNDLPVEIEELSRSIIGCAIEVHRELGPGLLEKIYEDALVYELEQKAITVQRQAEIVIPYKSAELRGQGLDLLVSGLIVVEIKSVSKIMEVHSAQLLSYLRAAKLPLGLLFNFNVTWLREGMHRVFNERSPIVSQLQDLITSRSSRPSR